MFNKNTKISFIIDKNNNLYIDIAKNKKDVNSYLKIAKLITMIETGELHTQILMAISSYMKDNPVERDKILEILNDCITKNKQMGNKSQEVRNPIIAPDIVLTAFRSNINT